ncbi:hypothetical protein J7I98_23575 [Streptomyces sp. ISL-98]|uniref:hypothetical protein n=1 Tax=Streptomyces sp. ISL-98 TaxID=2819192 RepID=UPI001BE7D31F|nr:hypothetical protein [Streptomyces sp. ISL-98]MBT2508811.1 hypothetical protein [Streptomyces sp. ISL-98]
MAVETCAGCTTTYAVGAPRCPQCGSTERTEGRGGAVLPSLTVECATADCMHYGKRRRVHLRTAAPGVLEMPSLVCAGCGLAMPQVPVPDVNEEDSMPKITAHGGPSNRYEDEAESETAAVPADSAPEGSEQPSAGSSSETSAEKQPTSPETSKPNSPSPARKTGNRSGKGRTGSSTARSTDGGQENDTSETISGSDSAKGN